MLIFSAFKSCLFLRVRKSKARVFSRRFSHCLGLWRHSSWAVSWFRLSSCARHRHDRSWRIDCCWRHLPQHLCFHQWKNVLPPRDTQIRKILARHELVNKRIRHFKMLQDRYKGDLDFHPTIFHAVINIVQLQIENGIPLAVINLAWLIFT